MTAAPNESEAAQIKQAYEQTTQEIERLKAKIQAIRKQKPNNLLHTEYQKYKLRESKRKHDENPNAATTKLRDNGTVTSEESSHTESIAATSESKLNHKNNLCELRCRLTEYKKLSGHGNKVYCAHWNPRDDTQLVSVGRDGKLIFWNADSGYKRLAYPLDTEFIMTLKYSPSAELVACGGLDDILSIFPVKMEQSGICNDIEPQIYKAHTGYISCLEYIDNHTILSSSGDATIRSWDITKNQQNTPTFTYKIHREDVMCIHVNPHNRELLLTGSVDSTAKIIDFRIKTEEIKDENEYNGGKNVTHSFYMGYDQDLSKKKRSTDVNVVKWFPDGHSFVAGCDDGTVRLFDVRTGRILNEYSYHRDYLRKGHKGYDGGYDSNGNSMVITSTNTPIGGTNAIDVYEHKGDNVHDDQEHEEMDEEDDDKAIHNCKPIIASDEDPDYYPTDEDMDPTDGVATLDFSKSGAFMFVSYNNDKHKVLTWNMLSGEVVQQLKHEGHVPSLAVSSDGRKLVTACWDHHLKLWS